MRKPKILFYTHGLVDGGAERLWACLATAFHERGYDVIFAEEFAADDNRGNLALGIPVLHLGSNHIKATWKLARFLARERPDAALSAIGSCNTKLLLASLLSRSPTRPIITYHGFNEWKTGWLSFAAYAGAPVMSRLAARMVVGAQGLHAELLTRWRAAKNNTVTILNPVFFPKNTVVPTREELAARENIVLAVGRLVADKDFSTLIRAFARVTAPGARLVILGKGPQQAMLEKEIARLGLTGRVTLAGYSREPWSHYASAKCFVHSAVSEMFGNVIVEAMASGLPIVATACTGPVEILDNGRYGEVVALRDETGLAAAINRTLADPGDPAERRARAEDFSFDVRVPAYERLVTDVLADRHGRPANLVGETAR